MIALLFTYILFVNIPIFSMNSPFITAIKELNSIKIAQLLGMGVDVNMISAEDESPLHYLTRTFKNPKAPIIFEMLVDAGANLNIQNSRGTAPLHLAVDCKIVEAIERLLKAGANPTLQDKNGETPLHKATCWTTNQAQYIHIAQLLIKAGAEILIKNHHLNTPFETILSRVHSKKISHLCGKPFARPSLLEGIYDVRIPYAAFCDNNIWTILNSQSNELIHYCTQNPHLVNKQDEIGATLLMYAATQGRKHMVKILIAHGADATLRDTWGRNVFDRVAVIMTNKKITIEQKQIYQDILKTCRAAVYKYVASVRLIVYRLHQEKQSCYLFLPKDILLYLATLMIGRDAMSLNKLTLKKPGSSA